MRIAEVRLLICPDPIVNLISAIGNFAQSYQFLTHWSIGSPAEPEVCGGFGFAVLPPVDQKSKVGLYPFEPVVAQAVEYP